MWYMVDLGHPLDLTNLEAARFGLPLSESFNRHFHQASSFVIGDLPALSRPPNDLRGDGDSLTRHVPSSKLYLVDEIESALAPLDSRIWLGWT